MPRTDHYRKLAEQYTLMAERAMSPLLAEGYRRLAEGYAVLATAHDRSEAAEADRSTTIRVDG